MIHPATELRLIDENIGYGVFATDFIPQGTVVYAKDPLEVELTQDDYDRLDIPLKEAADKYSYTNEHGNRVISWDFAKYVNHRCDCNTMSTGYGFEIAIKDIFPGDEITDEYGLFSFEKEMKIDCGCISCRTLIQPDDIDKYHHIWDSQIQQALSFFHTVDQPLLQYLEYSVHKSVIDYLNGKTEYRSVINLKYKAIKSNNHHQKYPQSSFR